MSCLLSWTLVWITLYSLETMEIGSISHLQMWNQVKTANYRSSRREISWSLPRDCSHFLCWMSIFDIKLSVPLGKIPSEVCSLCRTMGSVQSERTAWMCSPVIQREDPATSMVFIYRWAAILLSVLNEIIFKPVIILPIEEQKEFWSWMCYLFHPFVDTYPCLVFGWHGHWAINHWSERS